MARSQYFSVFAILLMLYGNEIAADEITYTITGRIVVSEDTSYPNPWALEYGSSDTPYTITMTFEDREYPYASTGYGEAINIYASTPNSGFLYGEMTLGEETAQIDTNYSLYMRFAEEFPIDSQTFNLVNSTFRVRLRGKSNLVGVLAALNQAAFDFSGGTSKLPELSLGEDDFYRNDGRFGAYTYVTTSITCNCNTIPEANAGPDQVVDCTNSDGAVVTLNATASFDPDGDELTYEWSVPNGVVLDVPTSPTPTGIFPIGITTATLTVTDGNGGLDVDDVVVTVVDQTPPEVVCTTSVAAIWPPNHKMIPVMIYVDATDHCTNPEDLILGLVTVESNEPDDAEGLGDGETTGDVDGQDGFTAPVDVTDLLTYNPETASFEGLVLLRAERNGEGVGRSYSINTTVIDSSNNIADTSCVVVVPHDRRKQK